MAQVKQWLAMAAFLASIDHMGSLKHKATKNFISNINGIYIKKRKVHVSYLRAPTVAEGLKIISAPCMLYMNQLSG